MKIRFGQSSKRNFPRRNTNISFIISNTLNRPSTDISIIQNNLHPKKHQPTFHRTSKPTFYHWKLHTEDTSDFRIRKLRISQFRLANYKEVGERLKAFEQALESVQLLVYCSHKQTANRRCCLRIRLFSKRVRNVGKVVVFRPWVARVFPLVWFLRVMFAPC